MQIHITTELKQNCKGVEKLISFFEKKGNLSLDFKKGKIIIEDLERSKLEDLLQIIWQHFFVISFEVKNETKFKLQTNEKELNAKKEKIHQEIKKKPSTLSSKVKEYVFKEKVFTLTHLRKAFPDSNFATLRSYVNDMKKDQILIELERGKYCVR